LIRDARRSTRSRWGYTALRLPLTAKVAVEGPPGGGKSTLASRIAVDLAAQGHRVLYLSVEEGQEETCVDRLRRVCGLLDVAPPAALLVADVQDVHEADEEVRAFRDHGGQGVIVVDSLTELDASAAWWGELLAAPRLGVLLIQHLTTSGQPRGGLAPAYTAQVRLVVADLHAQVVKNRFGPCQDFPVLPPPTQAVHPDGVVPFPLEP